MDVEGRLPGGGLAPASPTSKVNEETGLLKIAGYMCDAKEKGLNRGPSSSLES